MNQKTRSSKNFGLHLATSALPARQASFGHQISPRRRTWFGFRQSFAPG
jgi:hypothetical protein